MVCGAGALGRAGGRTRDATHQAIEKPLRPQNSKVLNLDELYHAELVALKKKPGSASELQSPPTMDGCCPTTEP